MPTWEHIGLIQNVCVCLCVGWLDNLGTEITLNGQAMQCEKREQVKTRMVIDGAEYPQKAADR